MFPELEGSLVTPELTPKGTTQVGRAIDDDCIEDLNPTKKQTKRT